MVAKLVALNGRSSDLEPEEQLREDNDRPKREMNKSLVFIAWKEFECVFGLSRKPSQVPYIGPWSSDFAYP